MLVIEGVLCALFTETTRRMMARALDMPLSVLRIGGLVCALLGFAVVWLVRGATG